MRTIQRWILVCVSAIWPSHGGSGGGGGTASMGTTIDALNKTFGDSASALRPPPKGVTHWSARELAVNPSTVDREVMQRPCVINMISGTER